ncbi:hypothetical protein CEXT_370901 [Caerostris extrusa]|uniref:Uncharacterized protein n=1 Tax=Caerostris extrusa TaxID=172846 RepID=A0AAV4TTH5_CAEEX|nr:hypothetical protein CEXT_370901 [Caerostris extrusa]
MNLDNLTEPDPPLPQAPKNPPIMVHRAENIKAQHKPIKDSFKDIKITLPGEFFKNFAKDSDEHLNVTKFLQNNKMDFYLITPVMKGQLKPLSKDFLEIRLQRKLSKNCPCSISGTRHLYSTMMSKNCRTSISKF